MRSWGRLRWWRRAGRQRRTWLRRPPRGRGRGTSRRSHRRSSRTSWAARASGRRTPSSRTRSVNSARVHARCCALTCTAAAVGRGLGAGVVERAAPVAGGRADLGRGRRRPPSTLARGLSWRASSSVMRCCRRLAAALEVGPDQLVLAAERAVQRSLGDAGALDDAVDADGVHALGVEELVRGGEQALARRGPPARAGDVGAAVVAMALTVTDRSVYRLADADRPVCSSAVREAHADGRAAGRPCPAARSAAAGRGRRFVLLASVVVTFLAGSSAPTPLYATYQAGVGLLADHDDGRLRRLRRRACCPRCSPSARCPTMSVAGRSFSWRSPCRR